jgi:hypothetical protein
MWTNFDKPCRLCKESLRIPMLLFKSLDEKIRAYKLRVPNFRGGNGPMILSLQIVQYVTKNSVFTSVVITADTVVKYFVMNARHELPLSPAAKSQLECVMHAIKN